jgi:hypothetical protein
VNYQAQRENLEDNVSGFRREWFIFGLPDLATG